MSDIDTHSTAFVALDLGTIAFVLDSMRDLTAWLQDNTGSFPGAHVWPGSATALVIQPTTLEEADRVVKWLATDDGIVDTDAVEAIANRIGQTSAPLSLRADITTRRIGRVVHVDRMWGREVVRVVVDDELWQR